MATYFGEVLPITSRAVDEEEEEDIPIPELYFDTKIVEPLNCSSLILAEGLNAALFIENYVIRGSKEIGKIVRKLKESELDDSFVSGLDYKKASPIYGNLYSIVIKGETVVILAIRNPLPEETQNTLLEDLLKLVKVGSNTKVYCLTSKDVYTYLSHESVEYCPFLRSLATSKYTSTQKIAPPLECPNTIFGISAALLTHCQLFDIAALAIISYIDAEIDDFSIKSFIPFLDIPELSGEVQAGSISLKHLIGVFESKKYGNLYC